MRRVYCLYRVSTEQQVEKHDILMQREAILSGRAGADAVSGTRVLRPLWKKERFLSTCTQSEALLKALRGKSDQAAMDVLHSLIKRIDVRGTNDVSITYFFSSADESEAHGDLPALAASNP